MNYEQSSKKSHHAMALALSHLDDAIMQLGRVARHAEATTIGAVALDLQAQVVAFTQRPLINAIAHSKSADLLISNHADVEGGHAEHIEVASEVEALEVEMSVEARTAFVLGYLSVMRAYHLLRLMSSRPGRAQPVIVEAALELAQDFGAIVLRMSRYRALLVAK